MKPSAISFPVKPALVCCVLLLVAGCRKPDDKPEEAFNAFLRAVHRQDCKKAWTFFSVQSQEKIRKESEKAVKDAPYYATQFAPENLYCMSTYANRFLSFERGSARLATTDHTHAVVTATLKEGTDFLIPGFFPTKYKRIPVEMNMVRENGAWKIDLITPDTSENDIRAARARGLEIERRAVEEARRAREAQLNPAKTNPPAKSSNTDSP